MSLRLQLLAAFAYVLLLIIVALEVPLALNLARRIDAEVKNEAAGQAFVATITACAAASFLTSASILRARLSASGTSRATRISTRT